MSEPRPTSRNRRTTLDPRLLLGIALVIASVAGVVAIVSATDRRVTVLAAADTLTPGDAIGVDDLLQRQVALDEAGALYLTPAELRSTHLVATAVVRRGELIPRSAVSTAEGAETTSVVLALAGGVSESVVAGALVDVWASPKLNGDGEIAGLGGFGPPTVLGPEATVVQVVEPDGIVSAADGRSVEVLVPRSRIARLLQAIANGDALAVVPAGIPLAVR